MSTAKFRIASPVIQLNNIAIEAVIGVYASERQAPQPLMLDVEIVLATNKACLTDHVDDTFDYDQLAPMIEQIKDLQPQLLEHWAAELGKLLLANASIEQATLCVTKPQAIELTKDVRVCVHVQRD